VRRSGPSTPKAAPERAIIIHVPLTFKKHGGRKQVITPDGTPAAIRAVKSGDAENNPNPSVIRALARAHRWKEMLESGCYGSITELADAEKVNRSYLCRVLRLTLLAPEIVQAILDGDSASLSLGQLGQPFAAEWHQHCPEHHWRRRWRRKQGSPESDRKSISACHGTGGGNRTMVGGGKLGPT
jgi:hypothetical protein